MPTVSFFWVRIDLPAQRSVNNPLCDVRFFRVSRDACPLDVAWQGTSITIATAGTIAEVKMLGASPDQLAQAYRDLTMQESDCDVTWQQHAPADLLSRLNQRDYSVFSEISWVRKDERPT